MDFFDNLLQSFSAKDLRSRVTGVVFTGFTLAIIAAVGMYFLLTSEQQISINGVGRWSPDDQNVLVISLTPDDLARLGDVKSLRAELLDPTRGIAEISTNVLSVNPAVSTIAIDASNAPPYLRHLDKMDAKLIIIERPMWQLLWGQ